MFDKFFYDELLFVSGIKKNTIVKVMEEYEVPSGRIHSSRPDSRSGRQEWVSDISLSLGGSNGYTEEYAALHYQPV